MPVAAPPTTPPTTPLPSRAARTARVAPVVRAANRVVPFTRPAEPLLQQALRGFQAAAQAVFTRAGPMAGAVAGAVGASLLALLALGGDSARPASVRERLLPLLAERRAGLGETFEVLADAVRELTGWPDLSGHRAALQGLLTRSRRKIESLAGRQPEQAARELAALFAALGLKAGGRASALQTAREIVARSRRPAAAATPTLRPPATRVPHVRGAGTAAEVEQRELQRRALAVKRAEAAFDQRRKTLLPGGDLLALARQVYDAFGLRRLGVSRSEFVAQVTRGLAGAPGAKTPGGAAVAGSGATVGAHAPAAPAGGPATQAVAGGTAGGTSGAAAGGPSGGTAGTAVTNPWGRGGVANESGDIGLPPYFWDPAMTPAQFAARLETIGFEVPGLHPSWRPTAVQKQGLRHLFAHRARLQDVLGREFPSREAATDALLRELRAMEAQTPGMFRVELGFAIAPRSPDGQRWGLGLTAIGHPLDVGAHFVGDAFVRRPPAHLADDFLHVHPSRPAVVPSAPAPASASASAAGPQLPGFLNSRAAPAARGQALPLRGFSTYDVLFALDYGRSVLVYDNGVALRLEVGLPWMRADPAVRQATLRAVLALIQSLPARAAGQPVPEYVQAHRQRIEQLRRAFAQLPFTIEQIGATPAGQRPAGVSHLGVDLTPPGRLSRREETPAPR